MTTQYVEFLKLCGFEDDELDGEGSRVDEAFVILGISSSDVEQAVKRVREFFDIELIGIRKALGVWIKQIADLVLAKKEGKVVIYSSFPPSGVVSLAATMARSDVYCQAPEVVLDIVMGQIFDKINPILHSGETHGLPPGLGHCSLNQARLGGIAMGICPIPDFTLSSSFGCDQTAKIDDLLHEVYGISTIFIDSCQDSEWNEFPTIAPRRIEYLGAQIRRGLDEVQKRLGVEISDQLIRAVRLEMAKLWHSWDQLLQLLRNDPLPISQVDLGLFFPMLFSPERRVLSEGTKLIGILQNELKGRTDKGIGGKGVAEKGSPRVLYMLSHVTEPKITRMLEESGLALCVPLLGVLSPTEFAKGGQEYVKLEERQAMAELKKGMFHSASAMIHRCKELCEHWKVDGVIINYPFSCRPYAIIPFMVKRGIQDELGIPALILETDWYDARSYTPGSLKTRVESFAQMLRAHKA